MLMRYETLPSDSLYTSRHLPMIYTLHLTPASRTSTRLRHQAYAIVRITLAAPPIITRIIEIRKAVGKELPTDS